MYGCVHYKVLGELSGLRDATMTVLLYWFSLRTFDWLPVSVLGYMEFFLVPEREVGPDSHYALRRRASKGYNAGSFWLGTAQLGLAPLALAFPSILHFNEWQRHAHQWLQ